MHATGYVIMGMKLYWMQSNTHNKTHAIGDNKTNNYRKLNYLSKLEMKLY